MMINNYKFGVISLDNNKKYFKDLIINDEKIIYPWVREEGHFLQLKDLENIKESFKDKEKIILIGNGYSGMMKISEEVLNFFKKEKLNFLILTTKEAWKKFNEFKKQNRKVIGLFHLTC